MTDIIPTVDSTTGRWNAQGVEAVQDAVSTMFPGAVYDDAAGTITLPVTTVAQVAGLQASYVQMRTTPPDHAIAPVYVDVSVSPPVVKGWNGTAWVPVGAGTAPAVTVTDNGDGTVTRSGPGVTDNGDGTVTYTGSNVVDNGDGTYSIAA